ncbi:MAG: SRPBCC family protein [Chloroflexota bacterium]
MTTLQHRVFIEAPRDRVFEMIASPERAAEWATGVISVRSVGDAPIAVGSQTEAIISFMGSRQRAIGRCVVLERPSRLVVESRTDLGASSRSDTQLSAQPGGTLLSATMEYSVPGGGLGRLLDKLVAERKIRQDFVDGLERLKTLIEREHRASSPEGSAG